MPAINVRTLRRLYETQGRARTCAHLDESIRAGDLLPTDFSLRELFEGLVEDGPEIVRSWNPNAKSAQMFEFAYVDTSAFSHITGTLLFTRLMQDYQLEEFILTRIVPNIPTQFSGEKVPGVTGIGDEATIVGESVDYPLVGLGEDWITTPPTVKRGMIIPITREAIFFDRTGLILRKAAEIGRWMGVNKEKRLADLLIGTTNNYKWRDTTYNTYQTSSPWINSITGNELNDWTDIDNMEQLFVNMLDPNTGEPIVITGAQLMVSPAKMHVARHITQATTVEKVDNLAAAITYRSLGANMVAGYTPFASRYVYRRLIASGLSAADAANVMFFGNFAEAFAYFENWPIQVTQAPQNSEPEFTADIVARFKVSERGQAVVMNPRYVIKSAG